ncbi:MAG: hypothetical protein ACKVUS_03665 [Saprospiraceae bacterium]
MKEVVLQIRENEYDFVLKLLQQFRFVQVVERPDSDSINAEKMEVLKSIRQGLKEAGEIQQGKLPKKTLSEFIAEVSN